MFLIDAHNDTPYRIYWENGALYENSFHNSIKKQKGFRTLLLYAIFMDPDKLSEFSTPMVYFEALYERFMREIWKNPDEIELVTSAKALPLAKKQQAMLTVEGGSLIDSVEDVDYLRKKGIKILTLTWNDSNKIAKSQMSKESGGLSPFGQKVIEKMNRLGMIADLSHASDETFWDVLSVSEKPVLVSHSNSRELCNHPRNVTDEMYKALMENGGVLGISFYPPFLGENA
ncbi:MAG: membrane dipeptidase, partial [Clostridia bacterium]|nr:membrane dipeptidase [Clostridia bacterium]